MKTWMDIPGWLSEAEGSALRRLACGKTVLELGSYQGRSTVCMAEMALEVTALDHHKGDPAVGSADTFPAFLANIRAFGVDGHVDVINADIGEAGTKLPDASFDLVFIDSAHDAQSVERDARLALRVVRPGGVIAFHDAHYPSVQEGLTAAGIDGTHPDYLVDSLAWIEIKDKDTEPA